LGEEFLVCAAHRYPEGLANLWRESVCSALHSLWEPEELFLWFLDLG
jgi:hypothetical protein